MTTPSYEELRITKHSGSPQIADSAARDKSSNASTEIRPVRIQRKRTKGWRMPANAVCVTRPTKWGNPFTERVWGRELAIALFVDACNDVFDPGTIPAEFEDWRFADASQIASTWRREFRYGCGTRNTIKEELRGKDLACWCPLDQQCHADVLLKIANDAAEN